MENFNLTQYLSPLIFVEYFNILNNKNVFSKIFSNKITSPKVHLGQIHLHIVLFFFSKVASTSINFIKLEGELQPTLTSLD
jgi:hypothetical protein